MKIAIDAMGGDHAPSEVIKGTLDCAAELPQHTYILTGPRERIEPHLTQKPPNVQVEHCTQVIGMDEPPIESLKKKRDNSIMKAVKCVLEKRADACVSAGNTGALVAAAIFKLGLMEGVKRAGILVPIPTEKGFSGMIDAGANPTPRPLHLLQYALMASTYMKLLGGVENPRVGLLNIGEEAVKGTALSVESYQMFKRVLSHQFVGNIEGHQIFSGKCDVIVCDGFTGNVVLKMGEGMMAYMVRQFMSNGLANEQVKEYVNKVAARFDYTEHGGAPVLGVNGIVIKGHGRSQARAINQAIRAAVNLAERRLPEHVSAELTKASLWSRFRSWFGDKWKEE